MENNIVIQQQINENISVHDRFETVNSTTSYSYETTINTGRMEYLCKEYNIDISIPKTYLKLVGVVDKSFYYDLPAGTGKTIGLAIAVACCDSLSIIYSCQNHSRLKEFYNILSKFMNEHEIKYVNSSTDFNLELLPSIRVLLMTSSMLINSKLFTHTFYVRKDMVNIPRLLVIDELPNIINKLHYDRLMMALFFRSLMTDKSFIDDKNFTDGIPPIFINSKGMIKAVEGQFNAGFISFEDIAINNYKNSEIGLDSKGFFLNLVRRFEWKTPEDILSTPVVVEDSSTTKYLTIKELYTYRGNNLLILDATSDLYCDLIESEKLDENYNKNYKDYTNRIVDLSNTKELMSHEYSKYYIINNIVGILSDIIDYTNKLSTPSYIITHNSAIYDGEGNDKLIKDFVQEFLNTRYKYVTINADYIHCSNLSNKIIQDNDIIISNYNRCRGTNSFKECSNVFLIGEFRLPIDELDNVLDGWEHNEFKDRKFPYNSEELCIRLSVADAIQEINRGCMRKRNVNSKENIYLFGSNEWIQRICNYLDVELVDEDLDVIENPVARKLTKYILQNSNSLRKATRLEFLKLICQESELSKSGQISWSEILTFAQEINSEKFRKYYYILDILKSTGLNDEEINSIFFD